MEKVHNFSSKESFGSMCKYDHFVQGTSEKSILNLWIYSSNVMIKETWMCQRKKNTVKLMSLKSRKQLADKKRNLRLKTQNKC